MLTSRSHVALIMAALMTFTGPALSQRSPGPPISDSELQARNVIPLLEVLMSPLATKKPVFLAMVTRVDLQPTEVYSRFTARFPGFDPTLYVAVKGGRLDTQERLLGPQPPGYVEIDNSGLLSVIKPGASFDASHARGIPRMEVGQAWLIMLDPTAPSGRNVEVAVRLSAPSDVLIAMLRRHVAWMSAPDRQDVYTKILTAVSDTLASPESRIAAFWALVGWTLQGGTQLTQAPDYSRMLTVQLKLLGETGLPTPLKLLVAGSIDIDPTVDLVKDESSASILRIVVAQVTSETEKTTVECLARTLIRLARQRQGSPGTNEVAYHYPDAVAALELREAADLAQSGKSPITNQLAELKAKIAKDDVDPAVTVVTRRLP